MFVSLEGSWDQERGLHKCCAWFTSQMQYPVANTDYHQCPMSSMLLMDKCIYSFASRYRLSNKFRNTFMPLLLMA